MTTGREDKEHLQHHCMLTYRWSHRPKPIHIPRCTKLIFWAHFLAPTSHCSWTCPLLGTQQQKFAGWLDLPRRLQANMSKSILKTPTHKGHFSKVWPTINYTFSGPSANTLASCMDDQNVRDHLVNSPVIHHLHNICIVHSPTSLKRLRAAPGHIE